MYSRHLVLIDWMHTLSSKGIGSHKEELGRTDYLLIKGEKRRRRDFLWMGWQRVEPFVWMTVKNFVFHIDVSPPQWDFPLRIHLGSSPTQLSNQPRNFQFFLRCRRQKVAHRYQHRIIGGLDSDWWVAVGRFVPAWLSLLSWTPWPSSRNSGGGITILVFVLQLALHDDIRLRRRFGGEWRARISDG